MQKIMKMVAAIQMCSTDSVDDNLNMADKLIRKAVLQCAKLVVLPENFAWMGADNKDRTKIQEKIGKGKIQNFLSSLAKANKIWIVGGSIPIARRDPKRIYSSSLIFDDKGRLAAHYDKIHLFDAVISKQEKYIESKFVAPGERVVVVDTSVGRLGVVICFDIRFPYLFVELFKKKVDIIAIPAAFTVPTGQAHWEVLTRGRAIDTFSYVIAAAQGGSHPGGRKTYGHSLIVNPWGKVIAKRKNDKPGVVMGQINLKEVSSARKAIPLIMKTLVT